MKRVSIPRLHAAIERLAKLDVPRGGRLLPGFLVLKRAGLKLDEWVHIPQKEFDLLCEEYFLVRDPPSPHFPYFYPPLGEWRHANWPAGTVYTRMKDTTALRRAEKLEYRDSTYEWRLLPGYERVLPKYVKPASRIPLTDFVAWIRRYREFSDEVTVADLRRQLLKELNLQPSEVTRLFVDDDEESPDFFTTDDWPVAELVALLPPAPTDGTVADDDVEPPEPIADEEEEPPQEIQLDALVAAAEAHGLKLPRTMYAQLLAAIRSGKHVVLTGPPGTGKTTVAEVLAELARDSLQSSGYLLTTATADWTTFDTIGGLRPTRDGELQFQYGHFLEAISTNKWLVIDELNRSNFDRAFGQLFTVLSGQAVVLPFEDSKTKTRISLVPEGAAPPADTAAIIVPQAWRILATMNVFDKSLLFEMSYALMRRFVFVEVPSPDVTVYQSLIDVASEGSDVAASVAKDLLPVRSIKDVGPATFIEIARFAATRMSVEHSSKARIALEAFYGFLLPQFEGEDPSAVIAMYSKIRPVVGPTLDGELRRHLREVLDVDVPAAAGAVEDEPEDEELD